ncbi:MAG: hypothetical protein KF860_07995 [Cyclobacteriaceae bacterium]|nr:hypothetical protein [Cyclobacteriaceae bacterium]
MKFIISHDIDHYYWSDHILKDLFIPKYIIKNTLFYLRRQIPFSLYKARMKAFDSNRFGRLSELVEFNMEHEVPATFFMGVRNALNLSYSHNTALHIANYFAQMRIPLCLHGISYNNFERMKSEKEEFNRITSGNPISGIRMHYLRNESETLKYIHRLNYDFDSTLYELRDPYFIENSHTIEFPVSMMEVYEIRYNEIDIEKVKKATLERIDKALRLGLTYFTIIFHDHHYSKSFPLHKEWYEWLIVYLKKAEAEFIDFTGASKLVREQMSEGPLNES